MWCAPTICNSQHGGLCRRLSPGAVGNAGHENTDRLYIGLAIADNDTV